MQETPQERKEQSLRDGSATRLNLPGDERYGYVEAIARKLRMLAETLSGHARLIQERGHA